MFNNLNFKFLLVILLLCLSCYAFCEDIKTDKGPDVVCMIVYANKLPTMINITYKEDIQKSRLEDNIKKLEKAFNGKFEILQTDENAKGITAIINDTKIIPGKGSSIEPFVKTFSDKTNIILVFTGDFDANKDPLVLYKKDNFSIMGNINDTSYQYTIKSKGDNKVYNLPNGQKTITINKVAKAIGRIIFYIFIVVIIIFVMIILSKRTIRRHKTRS